MLALGHVHHGTHVLNEIARWVENGVSYDVDVSDLASGMDDSVIRLIVDLVATRCRRYFADLGLVVGMDALQECFEARQSVVRIKTKHAIAFFGPVPHCPGCRDLFPTARTNGPLGFRQVRLTSLQLLFLEF